ncbi:ClC family H(+)/Cl(-) exchange transporter [Erysipelothrix sp. strain 2 (EsS2-6-Brazil)]|nr:ClC family H(+)/Cl(-) exchange transporter [Erysipelothrix sp. strain 2 (EsS2-6-Brazil)]
MKKKLGVVILKKKEQIINYFDKTRLAFIGKGILVGICAGLVVSLFRYLIEELLGLVKLGYALLHINPQMILFWVIASIILAMVLGLFIKKDPMIKGSGIPQIEGQILGVMHMNWLSIVLRKGVAGVLAIGSGLFLGREGPSIQLGAAVGQGVNEGFKGNRMSEKVLVSSGAGAGLAAAFNAPVAGLLFVLEEVHHNFSPLVLLTTLAATTTANFISLYFFGLRPILSFGYLQTFELKHYGFLVLLGVLLGVAGFIYQKVVLWIPTVYSKLKKIPPYFYGIIPFILVIPIGYFYPHLIGGGSDIIHLLAENPFGLSTLISIFILRFIFSMISYGSGLPGGIFLPILSLGALLGAIYGVFLTTQFGFDPNLLKSFIVIAMAGYFTAIGKAPLTAIVLITEMVGNFDQLMPMAVVSLVAYVISDLCGGEPVYEAMLERLVGEREPNITGQKVIVELCVHVESALDGCMVRDVSWPRSSLLTGISRGDHEFIPHGDSIICAGDTLMILTNRDSSAEVREYLSSYVGVKKAV